MSFEKVNNMGKLIISEKIIAQIAGEAAMECYGVVAMSNQKFKDSVVEILKQENYAKGVKVKQEDDNMIIDIYLVIAYGIKLSEVALEVQKKIRYTLESTLDITVNSVNVHVQDIKVIQ
ncbi:MAG: Asp23/Gls24 family envelope stress response protein [Bacilli bacterium]|nr:Asp23/Gls24 family envelope stress response protein [Bacilli bacterium]